MIDILTILRNYLRYFIAPNTSVFFPDWIFIGLGILVAVVVFLYVVGLMVASMDIKSEKLALYVFGIIILSILVNISDLQGFLLFGVLTVWMICFIFVPIFMLLDGFFTTVSLFRISFWKLGFLIGILVFGGVIHHLNFLHGDIIIKTTIVVLDVVLVLYLFSQIDGYGELFYILMPIVYFLGSFMRPELFSDMVGEIALRVDGDNLGVFVVYGKLFAFGLKYSFPVGLIFGLFGVVFVGQSD